MLILSIDRFRIIANSLSLQVQERPVLKSDPGQWQKSDFGQWQKSDSGQWQKSDSGQRQIVQAAVAVNSRNQFKQLWL